MAQINKPSEYFNTKLYTGNGSTQSITGVNFQPDIVWVKHRNSGTLWNHSVHDSVRGSTKYIASNTTDSEVTDANSVTSFDNDGFSIGNFVKINESGTNFVSWNWKANGAGVSNTDGSITSTVSVNTTSGFSIVSYTGTGATATIGHGLGVTPAMFIVKSRSTAGTSWMTWSKHFSSATDTFLRLNTTASVQTISNFWGTSAPNSTTFGVGAGGYDNNVSGATTIAYCFAEKKSFSKFGKYTGNGNANGPFIYTGFKPAFVIIKVYSGNTGGWDMYDNKRVTVNPNNVFLQANDAGAESTGDSVDFLSNGFKIRSTSGNQNGSGNLHIYMAFAENPLVGTNGVPATAR